MTRTITAVKEISKHQVTRFLIVGFLSFLVEFSIFTFLVDVAHMKYTYANLPAMGVAILFNYVLTSRLVFEPGRYSGKVTFMLFISFTMAGVILNQFLLWFLVDKLAFDIKISKVAVVGSVAVFNYFTKKHFVF